MLEFREGGLRNRVKEEEVRRRRVWERRMTMWKMEEGDRQ